jgi:hypothetical protein
MRSYMCGASDNVDSPAKYRLLVGKPEGRRPLGRPSRRCEAIKIYFKEKECKNMDRIIRLRAETSETLTNLGLP